MDKNMLLLIIYVGYLFLCSCVTFVLFMKDKKMATSGGGPVRIK